MIARASQIATWTGGRLIGADAPVAGVAQDSRVLPPGGLFVALKGERVDGHDFVAGLDGHAGAALVERVLDVRTPQIVVPDSLAALQALARAWLAALDLKLVALTGSNGKTTTKELTASILRRAGRTHATPGNYNNEIGVPLTVLGLDTDHRFAVIEMGAGKPDDIQPLTVIAPPDAAVVTNVGPAHLERLGSLEGVAATKGGIYRGLKADGIAVLNADEPFAASFERDIGARRVLRFGIDTPSEISASEVVLGSDTRFRLSTPLGTSQILLPLPGRHNVMNALAAAGLAMAVGASLDAITAGLNQAHGVSGRLKRIEWNGGVLFDDSYNANPGSLGAAIGTLALAPSPRWLVLGDMKELGPEGPAMHRASGRQAHAAGIDALFALGPLSAEAARGFGTGGEAFDDLDALVAAFRSAWRPGTTALIKGSRSSRMERVLQALGVGSGEH